MVFRRPRINVKPNVQGSRPSSNSLRSNESMTGESAPASQEEQTLSSSEPPPAIEEPVPPVEEERIKTPPPPQSPTILDSDPIPSSSVAVSFSAPTSTPTPPPAVRPIFRRKVAPNIGVRTAIHHRRPSASCSGTESETESSRQKHVSASSITFSRVNSVSIKSVTTNESLSTIVPDVSTSMDDSTTMTKTEALMNESTESTHALTEMNSSQIQSVPSSRSNLRISREYITQHITYRAQRLAHKVEPEKTIRKRRAATLGKIDRNNPNKDAPIDTSKLTIADFVHYNPVDNPMEPRTKSITTIEAPADAVRKQSLSGQDASSVALAPQLKLDANGSLVIDEESLYFRHTDDTPRNTVIIDENFNDDNLNHRSYRKIGRRKRWNNRDTLRFYQALRMCGTDFTLIANVFPNRSRDDVKRKFKTEDKANRTLIDAALSQRIPFDLTCFYSPSEDSSDDDNISDLESLSQKKTRQRRKGRTTATVLSDPLEINRRREKRLQAKKNSTRLKKSAEFIDDDDDEEIEDDERSIDIADTVEVTTTNNESKCDESVISTQNEMNTSIDTNMSELESLLGRIDGGHLLFVHNTDETTGLDRIDVHVVMSNGEQSI